MSAPTASAGSPAAGMVPPPPSPLAEPGAWNLVADGYTSHTVPLFEKYAAHALERAALAPHSYVLDVATGPGTLALLAARAGHRVTALDFARDMIAKLRERAHGLTLEAVEGDGQNLPFAERSFEAAFSMFGLIFFPDRARGFAELLRVLRPSGRALVSSWTPVESVPAMRVMFSALQGELPNLPFGSGTAPLGAPDELRDEMRAAGFRAVDVEQVAFTDEHESVAGYWAARAKGAVPLVLLRKKLGEAAWPDFEARVIERMTKELGPGPLHITWSANLGIGERG